jgi:anti-sigma B factor antagonist
MDIKTDNLKRCVLITVSGRIDSATSPQLKQAFQDVMDAGQHKIVLDMEGVDFISSAGLWVLVDAQKKCKRFNRGELLLACITQRVRSALELAGFDRYFQLFDETIQAVGSF